MTNFRVLLVALFLSPLGFTAPVAPADLAWGRWALLFVVVPGCPACERVVPWFARAAQTFPEIRFLLVAPGATRELADIAGTYGLSWTVDPGGRTGAGLGVRRAPALILLVDGKPLGRLDWPFTEEALTQELAGFLEFRLPTPRDLLGVPAPRFSAEDLSGREVTFADLARPLLLVFFSPDCPPCWDALPALAEMSREVAVTLLVVASGAGLAPADRGRLEQFVQGGVPGCARLVLLVQEETVKSYKVTRTPTYILLDEKGVITWVSDRPLQGGDLGEEVHRALRGVE